MTAIDPLTLPGDDLEALPPAADGAPAAIAVRSVLPAVTARPGTRGRVRAAVITARPRQWIKNGLVIAAPVAAGAIGHAGVPLRIGLAFVAFCLLASGVYAINDVRDVAEDRLHPRKRHRPVAAGELDPGTALAAGLTSIAIALGVCLALRPALALVALGYLAITLSYSLLWRRVRLLDVGAIASGFVLRAIAGGVAAPVALSFWFILVVTFAAVLVAGGKRYAELRRTQLLAGPRRPVLERYSAAQLRAILVLSGVATLCAYAVWAFTLPSVDGVPWRPLTILPFAACLLRYGAQLRAGDGEAPEDLLLGDRWLVVAGSAWMALFALGVQAAS